MGMEHTRNVAPLVLNSWAGKHPVKVACHLPTIAVPMGTGIEIENL